jgi:high-affinity nickel-transport protein
MEFSVAVMLVALGLANVVAFVRASRTLAKNQNATVMAHAHAHDHPSFGHVHTHGQDPGTHGPETASLVRMDRWFGGSSMYRHLRPLLVGIVHGLAGSAAVALLVLTTIRDPRWAVAYLLVFGVGTVAGMMLITMSIASAFNFLGRTHAGFNVRLGLVSGLLSLVFGLVLIYQIGFASGLFSSHPQWTPH